ncbi:MAG: YceI family protein [Actinomycetaceae bacterium]|nr:YceI family protein [Arcanobacterium sp.]MDD7505358.1 YceI family protein [Actinomycetaceae bacterium]MDY6143123.1 YceI family protein [Arcanobacterium sp.]
MATLKELQGKYVIDPAHSRLGFIARHAMVTKVRGSFDEFEGYAIGAGENLEDSTIEVHAKTTSIQTGNQARDKHLRSGDFFDAENNPEVIFKSTKVEIVDEETLNVTGDLTVAGKTNSLTIPFEFGGSVVDAYGNTRIGFEGLTKISRKEFGLTWNAALEAGGVMVGDVVTLEIEIAATKQED